MSVIVVVMNRSASLRVLHVIDSGGLYGAEAVLLELMSEQRALGLDPLLCSIGEPGVKDKPIEQAAELRGLSVQRLRMKPGPNPAGAVRVARLVRELRADIAHSHGCKGNILLGLLPRRRRGAPLVATLHGYTHTGGWKRMALHQWLDRRALSRLDRVVLVHAGMLADPRLARLRDDRWSVIENGLPPRGEGAPPDDEVSRFCRDGFTIGFVGRLAPEKGVDSLLDAVAQLARDGIAVRLAILGDGPQRAPLERRAKFLGLEHVTRFAGFVPRARDYMPLFRVFVLPSLTEGLPVTLLEAMQARTPIVATAVGGSPDVLQDGAGGRIVPPGDAGSLARAVREILDDPARAAEMVEASFGAVKARFSSARMAERHLASHRLLVGARPVMRRDAE